MLEKLKQRIIHLNLKKAVVIFIVIGLILASVSSVAIYSNLRDKNVEWENIEVLNREEETDYEQENKSELELHLSTADIALLIGCGIIGMVLGIWYWLLCVIWVYQKSYLMGINSALWVLGTLFFHIGAIAVLYLYAIVKGTCKNCGRLKSNHGKFCDRCGKPLKKECSQCGKVVDVEVGYCSNCGKKLYKSEE